MKTQPITTKEEREEYLANPAKYKQLRLTPGAIKLFHFVHNFNDLWVTSKDVAANFNIEPGVATGRLKGLAKSGYLYKVRLITSTGHENIYISAN